MRLRKECKISENNQACSYLHFLWAILILRLHVRSRPSCSRNHFLLSRNLGRHVKQINLPGLTGGRLNESQTFLENLPVGWNMTRSNCHISFAGHAHKSTVPTTNASDILRKTAHHVKVRHVMCTAAFPRSLIRWAWGHLI